MSSLEFNRIYLLDCIEGMKQIPRESVDLIVTDPPFAIDFCAKRGNYNRTPDLVMEGYTEITGKDYFQFTLDWLEQAKEVLKPSGSMYIFSGWNHLRDILNALDKAELPVVNHIIWQYQFGVVTKRKYTTSHYHCLYVCREPSLRRFYPYSRFSKDARDEKGSCLHYCDKEDVWYIKREYWRGDRKTPTKLPAELIRKILAYSSVEGDIVLDPFLGSGQVAVVSKMMSRSYIGFEVVREYYEFALERLEKDRYRLPDPKSSEKSGKQTGKAAEVTKIPKKRGRKKRTPPEIPQ